MRNKLLSIVLVVVFVLSLPIVVSASDYVYKGHVGYAYNGIGSINQELNTLGFELSQHNAYFENTFLFGAAALPNLYLGVKSNFSFSFDKDETVVTPEKSQAFMGQFSLIFVVEYNHPLNEKLSIGGGFDTGFNRLSLTLRHYDPVDDFDNVLTNGNYAKIWRPYYVVGGHVNVLYNISTNISLNFTSGVLFNIGIGQWLDAFAKIDGSNAILSNFISAYAALGVGFNF